MARFVNVSESMMSLAIQTTTIETRQAYFDPKRTVLLFLQPEFRDSNEESYDLIVKALGTFLTMN